jgi:general secretion pathway protein K
VTGRRGFALLASLWLMVALATLTLAVSLAARERRLAIANTLEALQARAAAEAGLEHARSRMGALLDRANQLNTTIRPDALLDPWADSELLFADEVALDGERYRVELRDAGMALHLNRAGENELRMLFVALRIDAGEADRLAQAIADWRDPDDLRRPRGAERDDYLAAGALELPRNGPFVSLDELLNVRGMTPERFALIRPYLTLLGTGEVNLNAAPRPVLLALPGMTEEAVALLLRRRQARRPVRSLAELAKELPSAPRRFLDDSLTALLARVTFETREVEVHSTGWVEGSPVRVRAEGVLVRASDAAFLVDVRVN